MSHPLQDWRESTLAARPLPGTQVLDKEWYTNSRKRHYRRNAAADWEPLDKYHCYYNTADYPTIQATLDACVAELDARAIAGEYPYGYVLIDTETAQGVTENIIINTSQSWGGLRISSETDAYIYGDFTFNATNAYPSVNFENVFVYGQIALNDLSPARDWGSSIVFKNGGANGVFLNTDAETGIRAVGSSFTDYTGVNLANAIIRNAPTAQYPPLISFEGGYFGCYGQRDMLNIYGSPVSPVFGLYSQIVIRNCQFDRPKAIVRLNGLHRAVEIVGNWYSGNPDQVGTDGTIVAMMAGAAAGHVRVARNRKPNGGTAIPLVQGRGAALFIEDNQLSATGGLLDWTAEAVAQYPVAVAIKIEGNMLTSSQAITGSTAPIRIVTPGLPSVIDGIVSGNHVSAAGAATNFLDIPAGNNLVVVGNNKKSVGLATNPPALAASNL